MTIQACIITRYVADKSDYCTMRHNYITVSASYSLFLRSTGADPVFFTLPFCTPVSAHCSTFYFNFKVKIIVLVIASSELILIIIIEQNIENFDKQYIARVEKQIQSTLTIKKCSTDKI